MDKQYGKGTASADSQHNNQPPSPNYQLTNKIVFLPTPLHKHGINLTLL